MVENDDIKDIKEALWSFGQKLVIKVAKKHAKTPPTAQLALIKTLLTCYLVSFDNILANVGEAFYTFP